MSEIIIIGLLISLIYTELTDISPGGIIIPAYLYIYLSDISKIILTLITSVLCVYIIKFLSRYMILYGRRKFTVYLIVGIFLKIIFTSFYFGNSYIFYDVSLTIGYIVPGILGRDIEKQGIFKTLGSLSIVILIINLVQVILT